MNAAVKQRELPPQRTIIWTDAPGDAAVALMKAIRNRGEKCAIRDACFYAGNSIEPAMRLVFFNCGKRDEIVRDYRDEAYVNRYGQIDVVDLEVDAMGAPVAMPSPLEAVVEQAAAADAEARAEMDQMDEQLLAMSPEDLRTYVTSMTGQRQRWNASPETLIKNLRIHLAGGKQEEVPEDETLPPKAPDPASGASDPPGSAGDNPAGGADDQ